MTSNDWTIDLAMRLERRRLLNTWIREFQPEILETIREGGTVEIEGRGTTVVATCTRFSPGGFHHFDAPVTVRDGGGSRVVDDVCALAVRLLATQADVRQERIADMLLRMRRSSAASMEHARFQKQTTRSALSPAVLEQSLWFGHPFHPLAKSIGGFSAADSEIYAPERGARFQLRWLLVNRRHVAEFRADGQGPAELDLRLLAASGLREDDVGQDVLFPCHPWQAARLETEPVFLNHIRSGEIRLTATQGDVAIPTSSVRTVWFAERNLFVKLPIEATITNFPRVNTEEQIARSIAGTEAIVAARAAVTDAGLTVLDEPVGRILLLRQSDGSVQYHPETGYLLRDAGFGGGGPPLVVAGLLETNVASGKANLAAVCGHRLQAPDSVERWLEAYTRIVLVPLLRLFDETGIALEAHSQNSLVRFEDGWPVHLIVRDLEGVAVDKNTFERRLKDRAMPLDPALFSDRRTVWMRLLYYAVVNHFSHVVATVAQVSGIDEGKLWFRARETLDGASGIEAVRDLLSLRTLPAKANLNSCLHGRGDKPNYVNIPNPFHVGEPQADPERYQPIGAEATR